MPHALHPVSLNDNILHNYRILSSQETDIGVIHQFACIHFHVSWVLCNFTHLCRFRGLHHIKKQNSSITQISHATLLYSHSHLFSQLFLNCGTHLSVLFPCNFVILRMLQKWNHITFCNWHNSLEIHQAAACINSLFLLLLGSIPWYGFTTI